MAIDRWDPFGDVLSMRDTMDRLLRESFMPMRTNAGAWAPRMDVLEHGDEYRVRLAMPGVKPEDVQINLEQNVLTVSGELRQEAAPAGGRYLHQEHLYGRFTRSIALPVGVDAAKAGAQFEHGVLTITVPKAEAARPRRIEISTGGDSLQSKPIEQATGGGEKGSTAPQGDVMTAGQPASATQTGTAAGPAKG